MFHNSTQIGFLDTFGLFHHHQNHWADKGEPVHISVQWTWRALSKILFNKNEKPTNLKEIQYAVQKFIQSKNIWFLISYRMFHSHSMANCIEILFFFSPLLSSLFSHHLTIIFFPAFVCVEFLMTRVFHFNLRSKQMEFNIIRIRRAHINVLIVFADCKLRISFQIVRLFPAVSIVFVSNSFAGYDRLLLPQIEKWSKKKTHSSFVSDSVVAVARRCH